MLAVAVLAAVTILVVTGCGGGPDAPSSVVVGVHLTGPTDLDIGRTATYTATATYADGSQRPAPGAAWGTDAPAVVTLDNTGELMARRQGVATIWADVDGRRATLFLTVHTSFTGTWHGQYRIGLCRQTYVFFELDACRYFEHAYQPMTVSIVQVGDWVTGSVAFPDPFGAVIPVAGPVVAGTILRLEDVTIENNDGVGITLMVWDTTLKGPMMEGRFERRFLIGSVSTMRFVGILDSVTRVPGS